MNDQLFQQVFDQFAKQIKELINVEVEKQVAQKLSHNFGVTTQASSNINPLVELEVLLDSFADNRKVETADADELLELLSDFSKSHKSYEGKTINNVSLKDLFENRAPVTKYDQVDFYIEALNSLKPVKTPATFNKVSNRSGIAFALDLLNRYKEKLNS
ncbi:MAG: hypothetical protein ACOZAK_03795 [Patescibacteria group bacterium]